MGLSKCLHNSFAHLYQLRDTAASVVGRLLVESDNALYAFYKAFPDGAPCPQYELLNGVTLLR
jgi:hypothetical protein